MQPFKQLSGAAVALRRDNVDTDQVIPARFLKISRAEGLGDKLFHDLRFDGNGKLRPDFPLNDPARQDAGILIGRRNFGVGSSREAAVYALVDHGFRCVVATSFGDIFAGNAVNNGLVAAIVNAEDIEKLLSAVEQTGRAEVDLEAQTIKSGNYVVSFTIDPARKTRLLNGWDELDLTAQHKGEIAAFATQDRTARPWAVPRT
ncbi:MAG: 3-isopropylmalate dehydratase small subunit [Alphaproteobacteria bacterium]|nr:MAG: 3-isopropylmalate dehydratase small subunit [Alphaproteobacteria bacterium]